MKILSPSASAAVLALTLAAASAPAQAAVIAQFTPNTNASDFKWVNAGTGGHFFSITSNASNVAQGVATHFSFLDGTLNNAAFIPAVFKIDATVNTGNPATVTAGVWRQGNLSGVFSFIYTGASIFNFNGSGVTLAHNSNLLSGIFTDAFIQGQGGSGSVNLADIQGGSASFTSAYDHANFASGTEEFAFTLLSATPAFGANLHKALKGFRANGGGNFEGQGVPEPATWGLMIVGFGGLGVMLRNNRRAAFVKA